MKESIIEKAVRILDLPGEILAGLPKIEIIGCREILIENHRGLLSYDTKEMHINGGKVMIKLSGDGFLIRAMNANELRIEGLLFGLEFEF